MSWISLEQLAVPVALTSFVVAVSMLMPTAAQGRGIALPPVAWSPGASQPSTRQATPGADEPGRSGSPDGSFAGSPVGSTVGSTVRALADPAATAATGQFAGASRSVSGSAAIGTPGRRRRGGGSGSSAAVALPLPVGAPARTPVGEIPRLRAPVPGRLVRGFDAPASPYGPGHRGVDLAAASGTPVTAPAPGRIRFAGQVGGTGWVSIEVATGVTVSVGPVARFQVRAGDDVGVLTVLGEAAEGHGGALHLGMRVQGDYADPQPYLVTFGPARLVPLEQPGGRQGQLPRSAPRPVPDRAPEAPARRRRGAPVSGRTRRRAGAQGQAASHPSGPRTARSSGTRSSGTRTASAERERARVV